MSALPSEAALLEMRARCLLHIEDSSAYFSIHTPADALSLLDCALTLRRLERWLRVHDAEAHLHISPSENGALVCAQLHDDDLAGAAYEPDLLAALRAALDKAEVRP